MKSEWAGVWRGLVLTGLWGWLVAITQVFAEDLPAFQVRLTTREIEPTSRFEVVFEKPMVAADQIGVPDVSSPLRIDPPVPGDFVWRSRRVGVFQPKEPLRLDTSYVFQPRSGLRDAEGKPIASRLRREIRTPELSLQIDSGDRFRSGSLGAMPAVLVSANAALNPQDLAARCVFQDGTSRIQARVEPVDFEDWEESHPGFEMPALTWADRFLKAPMASTTNTPKRESGAAFWVRPVAPLVSESPWVLRVGRGVRSADGRTRLASDVEAQIGISLPFALAARKADSSVEGGRQIRLEFSRPLPGSLKTNWNQWIGLSPEVLDIQGSVSGKVLSLRGGFQLNQKYDVEVAAALRSEDDVPFSSDSSKTNVLQFEPMPPRVWLPGYSEVQLLAGHRDFEVRSLNTPSVRLRVKALSRAGLIPALAGYERMRSASWDASRNPAPLEYAALAGRTVLETNLVVQERVDEVIRTPMGWDALVGAGRPGAFFVEVETLKGAPKGASGPQALVQLTDLGFVTKSGAERTWVWVVSQKTSQPLKGVTVSLCDSEDGTLTSGVTDERGLVVLPKQEAARWWVLELGSDIHVAPVGVGGVSAWGQGLPDGHWGSGPLAIWSFTDREAYRPGDRIHLHGQLRRWNGRDWQLPQVDVVELTVGDPRGQVVLKTNLTVTALGSCEWQGVLPEGSRGSHDLTLVSGNALWTGSIEVREFQPPAFEVRVALPQEISVGQPLSATVDARYLLGAPVTRGRLQWHAEAVDLGFEPEGWDEFFWPDPDRDAHSNPEAAQVHQTGSVALTSAEPIRIEADLPGHPNRPGPQLLRLTAEVTDPNQQTVSQVAEKIRQASDFYLGFRWAGGRESVQTTNHPLAFQVVASGPDGSPWTHAVAVRAILRRIEWKTVVVERAGGKLAHEQRRDLEDVGTRSLKTSAVVKRGILWRLAEGQAPEEGLRVERPGAYELELEATDGSGRLVRTVVEFHVEGDGRLAWHWHNGSRLGLVPDRSTLAPGEPARLLVEAPFSGTALVTVEREEVQEAFITRITGNAPSIEVPFTNSLAPNAMVGVFLMRGLDGNPHQHPMPEWRAGWVNFDFPDPDCRLAVEVGLGASPAQPGQEMPVTVSVRTAAGLPAAGAEVTLYAVDEGFLQLMGTQVPDPVAFWGAAHPLRVFTAQSFRSLLEEDPELLEFSNKGEIGGGGGRRGLSQRRRFIPCPLWEGSRVADEQGRVSSKFIVPDSLTRYRVVAVATHGVRRFGSSSSTFEVRKPLMVESGLPRFLHVGDRLQAQALVLNGTTNDIEARLSLKVPSTGISLEGGEASRVVRISAGASVPVSFPIQATASSDAEWTWRAEPVGSSAGVDAGDEVVVRLPVTRGVPDLVTAVWSRAGRDGTNLLAAMDPAVLESPRSAVVRVATGPLGFAGASIDWLARYPYGCVEQTSSMLVPSIAALRYPGLLGQVDPVEIRKRIAEGVRQLWAMQLGSGMLSAWPGGSDTADWGSVYAAWVLTRAAEAGIDVGSSRRERLLQALSEACRSGWVDRRRDDGSLASFVAMVLADSGRPDPSLNAVLLDKAEGLTPTSRAFLAWAMALQDPADDAMRAKAVALLDPVAASSKRNRARSLEDYWDPARLPAVRLLAGQKLGVDAATAERDLVALISEARRGFWSTTQGNAWALWAMASIAPVVPEAGVEGVLKQGGRDVPFQITTKNPVIRWQFPMEASAVARGIEVRSGSDQTLLVQAQVTAEDRADPTRAQAVDRGLGIQRTYQRLDEENRPGPLDGLRVGDRVLVTLRVDVPEDLDWLAIEDPIPSVLEPIQGVFRTATGASHPLIPAWSSDFQEVRGDRVRHFKDHVPDGVHWIRYVARVRSAGDVVAPPARAEAMYDPDRFGQSAGGRIQSAP